MASKRQDEKSGEDEMKEHGRAGRPRACPEALKVSARFQIDCMGLVWAGVGMMLLIRALWNLAPSAGPEEWLWFTLACLVGALKGRLVISRSAERLAKRIEARGDGHCILSIFPLRTWLLVACMVGLGYLLRNSGLNPVCIWSVYGGIGLALLMAGLRVLTSIRRRHV